MDITVATAARSQWGSSIETLLGLQFAALFVADMD
jgi:hypothetical protein